MKKLVDAGYSGYILAKRIYPKSMEMVVPSGAQHNVINTSELGRAQALHHLFSGPPQRRYYSSHQS